MFAPLIFFALSQLVPLSSLAGSPVWYEDYSLARHHGASSGKPLIVVIGSGKHGWDQVCKEGGWSKEVREVLAQNYICVYVDTDESRGKQLASAFEVGTTGMVISNRDGSIQAFRHEGQLSNEEMERFLERYADPFFVPRATESPLQERNNYYYQAPGTPVNSASIPLCRT